GVSAVGRIFGAVDADFGGDAGRDRLAEWIRCALPAGGWARNGRAFVRGRKSVDRFWRESRAKKDDFADGGGFGSGAGFGFGGRRHGGKFGDFSPGDRESRFGGIDGDNS